jgi:membrane associated rhomboid family serine protease
MQQSFFFLGHRHTPKGIKWIIWITVAVTLLAPFLTYWFEHAFHLPGPTAWLSLSRFGIQKGWLWQPLTYFFLHSAGIGISLSLLFTLFFNMLLLWFTGSEFATRYGTRNFILFYLGGGIVAGIVSTALLFLFSSSAVLVSSTPPIFALVIIWAMLYPDLELFFFFLIRIKGKWLAALYLAIALLMNLSGGAFISFFADLTGIVWGFCIGRFLCHLPNPFPLNLDFSPLKKKRTQNKIIDITVLHEDDDVFMDRMLDKIAAEGKESLTKVEELRMKKISERKNQEK